jgi:hypothetical protein
MAWAKAGPGRPRGSSNKGLSAVAESVRRQHRKRELEAGYEPKYSPYEVLQRALDGAKLPDGTDITADQAEYARDLLPYTMPKLQAIAIQQVAPPTPRIEEILRGSSLEALEMLRDALALCLDEAGRQIDGSAVAIEEDAA